MLFVRSLLKNSVSLLEYDKRFFDKGYANIIGADEAGRGPLAGPVIAGAVWISEDFLRANFPDEAILQFQDSKLLSETQRENAFKTLQKWQDDGVLKFSYGESSVAEIEMGNILYATTLAFRRALENLQTHLDFKLPSQETLLQKSEPNKVYIMVDGYRFKRLPYLHTGLVKGDRTSFCIAAASIVAKIVRDHKMCELDKLYPQYGFNEHKGYGTAQHIEVLKTFGPCYIHRKSFLKKILGNTSNSLRIQQQTLLSV